MTPPTKFPGKRLRLTLDRDELVTILWSLESTIEAYKYDGGLALAEREMALLEKLTQVHHDFDLRGKRRVA